ncbi:mandelate racemase/muconate lactonizing enzyme family protein [Rhodopila sp.]|jgi:L-alanine-DL-glutamate epimerase-like enolase superfamily enzyme|uniref:mandelate racemase/muconate lactonizing enzyme family protein n=1 Tax=Rhodopila sp. TaxID=2480087 RepID=UPI002B7175A2|nr:mandelate racemase/muconate lactonizing enzyme family protein [Rhodopila sp.]HVZ10222.1 mandelate racemase/muconate lactonizing enzyme family protein [Rhodopila sp.]
MKISSYEATILRIPEDDPLANMPEDPNRKRPIVTLRLRTDNGIEGIGVTFYGGAMTGALHKAVEELAALTIGEDPLRIAHIISRIHAGTGDSCGPAGLFTLALSAIDVALWDIKGKALDQPLWKLLGGHRDRVPTYASGSLRRGLTDDQAQRAAQILVQKGFREMKTQMALPGTPTIADEVRRVRVVREAIGPDIKLMCDINQRWRPEQAIDIGHRVEDVGLFWLEDVTRADDFQGLARVTAALKTPVAGGEYVYGIEPFRQMIQMHSVDIPMIDICRAGGVTPWMKIAGMAEAFNLPVVSHVMPEILVHLIAACPNGLTVEYMPWMLCLYEETPAVENGMMILPNKPGLGLAFNEKAVASFKA